MAEEKPRIELRSEEVEDILGKVPGWLTLNGTIMLFAVVFLLIAGAWIFKVPDVKKAEVTVSSLKPPADIEARSDGKIEELLIKDNDAVEAGQVLAVLENPADYTNVIGLKKELKKLNLHSGEWKGLDLPVNGNADLGMIQSDYATFYKNFRDYREFLQLNYHQRKIELLEKEYGQYEKYAINLENRSSILKEEYMLYRNQYRRDSILLIQGVISESVSENTKSQMLTKRAGWQEILSLKAENEIKMAGINEKILEMQLKKEEQLYLFTTSLEESLNRLNAAIAAWEKRFLIIAPIAGNVTFNVFWSENQNVRIGEKVMTVVPKENGSIIGKIKLPLQGAGEVEPGQQVNIRFENFPYLEYGMVKGIVSNVSKVPQDDFYTVEVDLPDGLKTYYGMEIGFSQNMKGKAEIITDKMRLLQRIFNPVRSALSRQREM